MKTFNITAQAYKTTDKNKQTILMNDMVQAYNLDSAKLQFYGNFPEYEIIKIYSIEEISQDLS